MHNCMLTDDCQTAQMFFAVSSLSLLLLAVSVSTTLAESKTNFCVCTSRVEKQPMQMWQYAIDACSECTPSESDAAKTGQSCEAHKPKSIDVVGTIDADVSPNSILNANGTNPAPAPAPANQPRSSSMSSSCIKKPLPLQEPTLFQIPPSEKDGSVQCSSPCCCYESFVLSDYNVANKTIGVNQLFSSCSQTNSSGTVHLLEATPAYFRVDKAKSGGVWPGNEYVMIGNSYVDLQARKLEGGVECRQIFNLDNGISSAVVAIICLSVALVICGVFAVILMMKSRRSQYTGV